MAYAFKELGVNRFIAKILETNAPSIALFGSLGYEETKRVAIFKEVYMEYAVVGDREEVLRSRAYGLLCKNYDP